MVLILPPRRKSLAPARDGTYLRRMSETSNTLNPRAIFLPDRALIAIGGKDAGHFLHNLLTANIEALQPGAGTAAALLTPQGKMIAEMLVFNASDGEDALYLIDVMRGFSDDLATRLTRYKLRAEVSIDILGEPVAVAVALDTPAPGGEDFYTFADPRAAGLGHRLYGPRESLAAAIATLPPGEIADYHARRVGLGVPEAGQDYLPADRFPHEVNLDQLGGIDFKKGCYIGQEVVSRMHHRAAARTRAMITRCLNGFSVDGGVPVKAGERLLGTVGECYDTRAITILRLDRLAEALATGAAITVGGVEAEISLPGYAKFALPVAGDAASDATPAS
jgi:folate-binding protein YgfZ